MQRRTVSLSVIYWLFTGCFLIFLMVFIGGATRLTNSGLSIVEWNLIMGTIPPLNEQQWVETFEKYQQSPEFKLVNSHFTLNEFKSIFWWEYIHRLLGRIIGMVFIIPFVYFLIKKKLPKELIPKLVIIFLLGGLQGALGWFMVKSGLNKHPDVSHYRLAAHLITAFITFGYTFWVGLDLLFPPDKQKDTDSRIAGMRRFGWIFMIVVSIQIIYGAFVAGLNAGKLYNTFPKMGDKWIPETIQISYSQKGILSLLENPGTVQFIHRLFAYSIFCMALFLFMQSKMHSKTLIQVKAGSFIMNVVIVQFLLGVLTVMMAVPLSLGLLHQIGAFFLFGAVLFYLQQLRRNGN